MVRDGAVSCDIVLVMNVLVVLAFFSLRLSSSVFPSSFFLSNRGHFVVLLLLLLLFFDIVVVVWWGVWVNVNRWYVAVRMGVMCAVMVVKQRERDVKIVDVVWEGELFFLGLGGICSSRWAIQVISALILTMKSISSIYAHGQIVVGGDV